MPALHRPRRLILAALVAATPLGLAPAAMAQDGVMAPTYSRTRSGVENWQARGPGHGQRGYGYGFYQPNYQQPIVAGSWYQRPYPYHFDYYRYRWGGGAPEQAPITDCPCATTEYPQPSSE